MPARKSTKTKRPPKSSVSTDLSYETKLTIVVLLLLFAYPLGVIFMWVWMKSWPVWLKILISLPVALIVLAIVTGVFFLTVLIHQATNDKNFRADMERLHDMKQQLLITPSPIQISPTDSSNPVSY